MKLKDLLEGVAVIEMTADPETEINNILRDSRLAHKGCMFAALPALTGGRHGIDYAQKAVQAGAECLLCDTDCPEGLPYVRVESAEKAFAICSANFHGNPAKRLRLIGVTGTNGKTTVTHLLKQVLESRGHSCGLIGTNHILIGSAELESKNTTPEAFELHGIFAKMVESGCEFGIMEVSSHALASGRVEGLRFEVGIFTNLTQDHLDFHGCMEAYAAAKRRLADMSEHFVINIDDDYASVFEEAAGEKKLTVSAARDRADIVAKEIRYNPDSVDFVALTTGKLCRMHLGIPGEFSVHNALSAIGGCAALGMSFEEIAPGLAGSEGPCGRAEIVKVDRPFSVMIDYAHTPDALENILMAVRPGVKGRIIAVFGCGGDRDRTKRPKMGAVVERLADVAVVTSDNPRTEDPDAIIAEIVAGMKKKTRPIVIENRREAIAKALSIAREDDLVILCGKGHETYQEINGVKYSFDEREVVRELLKED
ncbi:MAG: UDP-N-acetylmuramoyl-L-alanyl-D-glutamate--2,6-diaminopimelate ligase [Clostridia bacterium]|nr:UDP-N-acetylmuramoyl-L-alanyl-D-glutamate--2,6-diaminopimelate ligase [Clostridia bacterium]